MRLVNLWMLYAMHLNAIRFWYVDIWKSLCYMAKSSAAGIGILFAIMAQSISKGKGDSFISKIFGLHGVRKLLTIQKKKI
jgi:hypothetical protein